MAGNKKSMQAKTNTVLHIISSMRRGGRERQLAIITKYSTSIDNRILYYNDCVDGYIEQYELQNVSYHCQEKGCWKRLWATLKITQEIGANAVVSWGNMESIIAMIVSLLMRIPFINFSIRHGIRSKQFSHYFRTLVLHLSKNIIANSYAGLRANNLRRGYVLYNGIEEHRRSPTSDIIKEIFTKYDIRGEDTVLVSVANLVPYKDYFTVFAALKTLIDAGYAFHYFIIGEGPLRTEYESYIIRYGLHDRIHFIGRTRYPHIFLSFADIFVHSSKGEGCSNAILEAMSMGLPVIASDTGGTSEIVGDNAILFPYKDKLALQEAMIKLIEDKSLRREMGLKSEALFKGHFSLERMLTEYHNIIDRVLTNNKERKKLKDLVIPHRS